MPSSRPPPWIAESGAKSFGSMIPETSAPPPQASARRAPPACAGASAPESAGSTRAPSLPRRAPRSWPLPPPSATRTAWPCWPASSPSPIPGKWRALFSEREALRLASEYFQLCETRAGLGAAQGFEDALRGSKTLPRASRSAAILIQSHANPELLQPAQARLAASRPPAARRPEIQAWRAKQSKGVALASRRG